MTEVFVTVWIGTVGVIALAPLGSRLRWGLAGVAVPVGAALYVLTGMTLLALQVPFSVFTALGATTIIALGTAVVGRHAVQSELRATVQRSAIVVAGCTAAAATVAALHLTRLTADSIKYLLTANVLESTGSVAAANPWDLRMRHLAAPLLHAGGAADGVGYSATIAPLFALSGIIATAWLAWSAFERFGAPRKLRWYLLGSVGLLLISTNRLLFHSAYINGHMLFAVFATLGVGLVVHAAATDDWSFLLPASLALAAIVPLRPEGLITVAVLLVPALGVQRIPYSQRWRLLGPILLAAVLWNGIIWPANANDADLGILGPVYGNLFVAGGLALGLGLLALPRLRPIGHWGPLVLAAAMAAYLGISVFEDPDALRSSLAAMGANIAIEGLWGTTWWVLPLLLGGAWLVARTVESRLLLIPIPLFAMAIFVFAYLRDGAYRVGTGDSANRMLMHITLLAALAVLTAAAEASGEAVEAELPPARAPQRP